MTTSSAFRVALSEPRWGRWLIAAAILLTAGGVAAAVVQPFAVGPVGFDSASSVAFFQRIAAGQRLEAYLGTTPKPLLTVIYGVLYGTFADWRAISWATIAAFSVSVLMAARLSQRIAGPAAAIFVTVGLIALPLVQSDLILAYATPWAMVGWFGAGLLVTGPRPRYAWAGFALMLATLARLETLALLGVVLAGLAALQLAHRVVGWPAPPRRAWLLGIGLLAVPLMLLHDWLLTGDPFYWTLVSQTYSRSDPSAVQTPIHLLRVLGVRYVRQPLLSALALLGGLSLLYRRQVAVALGLIGLGPGVAVLLIVLAARATYVSTRYFEAIDVAVVTAAAVGTEAIVAWLWTGVGSRPAFVRAGWAGRAVMVGAIAMAAALGAQPLPAPLTAATQNAARTQRAVDQDTDLVLPAIQAALDTMPGARDGPPAGVDWDTGHAPPPVLVGPNLLRPRLAVDLRLPLSNIAGLGPSAMAPGPDFLDCAQLVLHDRNGDTPVDGYASLEIGAPVTLGGDVLLTPLVAEPTAGYWLIQVRRSGAAAAACEARQG